MAQPETLLALFPDGTRREMTARELERWRPSLLSWFRILNLARFGGSALIECQTSRGDKVEFKVVRLPRGEEEGLTYETA